MMRNRRFFATVTVALVVAALLVGLRTPVLGQQPQRVRVLIAFRRAPGAAEQALVVRAGGKVRTTYSLVPAVAASVPESAIAALQAHPTVLRVEPDLRARAVDTELDNAWGVTRIGSGEVHDAGNRGTGVSIAIIDSGVDYMHPDLNDNYAGGYDFVQDDYDPMDVYGHGTHVAGTACAEDNDNGTTDPAGVVGVAPECAIYSLRVLDDDGYGYASDIISAMQWAVEEGLQVANLSLGWDRDPGATVKEAFDQAWEAGLVTVAAAGNSGNPPGRGDNVIYPAKYASVIAVAATDNNDNRASFSSTGEEVELAAPGVSVFSTWNDSDSPHDPQPICGTDANGEHGCYKFGSGTSMASPHVAGTAALIIAGGITDSNGDGRINSEVRQRMNDTAEDLGAAGQDNQFGYGLVNAAAAAPAESAPAVSWVNPAQGETISGTITLQVDAAAGEDDPSTLTVEWRLDGGEWQTATYNTDTFCYEAEWDSSSLSDGEHTLEAQATAGDGTTAGAVVTVTTENTDDPPPVWWVTPQDGDTVNGALTIQIAARDDRDSGSDVHVEWQVDSGDWLTATYDEETGYYQDSFDTTAMDDGEHGLSTRATDTGGNSAAEHITVTVSNAGGGIYVWDISWQETGPHLKATVTILVDSDQDGIAESSDEPVSGADVAFRLTSDSAGSQSYTGTTDSAGQVAFQWKRAPSGTYTGDVIDLTHATHTWNPLLDADNPDAYTKE